MIESCTNIIQYFRFTFVRTSQTKWWWWKEWGGEARAVRLWWCMCTAAPHSCLLHHHRCSRLDSQTLLLGHTHTLHPPPACLACLRFFVPWLVRLVGREGRCPASGFPTSSLCTRSLLVRVLLWPGSDPPCTPATVQHMLFWCFSSNHFLPFENPCNFYSQVHVVSGPI